MERAPEVSVGQRIRYGGLVAFIMLAVAIGCKVSGLAVLASIGTLASHTAFAAVGFLLAIIFGEDRRSGS